MKTRTETRQDIEIMTPKGNSSGEDGTSTHGVHKVHGQQDCRGMHPEALKAMRCQAVRMVVFEGLSQREVARRLGIRRTTVNKWVQLYNECGEDGLNEVRRRGRKPGQGALLSPVQCATIVKLIGDNYPEQLKLPFVLWTADGVRELIYNRFKIKLSTRTVRDYLNRWGFVPKKPVPYAIEQDPDLVEYWVRAYWPRKCREARRRGATILFLDETGVKNHAKPGYTWGFPGCDVPIPSSGQRFGVNVICALSPKGDVSFMTFHGSFNSDVFIEFLTRLRTQYADKPLDIVLDGHPSHKSRKVFDWVKKQEKKIRLIFFPPYSPELNPTEYLNQDLKQHSRKQVHESREALEASTTEFFNMLDNDSRRTASYCEPPRKRFGLYV